MGSTIFDLEVIPLHLTAYFATCGLEQQVMMSWI